MLGKNWKELRNPKRKLEQAQDSTNIGEHPKQSSKKKRTKTSKSLKREHGIRQCANRSQKGDNGVISPSLEIARHKAITTLGKLFAEICQQHLQSRKYWAHFEAWLWAHRSSAEDPIIPMGEASLTDVELERKLQCAGASVEVAHEVCRKIGLAASGLARRLPKNATPGKVACVESGDKLRLTLNDFHVEVDANLYQRLAHLLSLHEYQGDRDEAILCCLTRYQAAAGCNQRAGGMQAALPPSVFDVLEQDFGVSMECFASPLNCNWPNFCSAFPDIDGAFGSCGNFFAFSPKTSLSLEANPPFDAKTVTLMTGHMEKLLSAKMALSFIVFIPCWEQSEDPSKKAAWTALSSSPMCCHHLLLPQADHAYCAGSETAQYHLANVDSSVFFLQNATASKKWPVTPSKLQRLQAAFRLKVPKQTEQSKQEPKQAQKQPTTKNKKPKTKKKGEV